MTAGHIQKRGARSWRLKFDRGRDPDTGKRLTTYATVQGSMRDAQAELTKRLAEIQAGTFVQASKTTVGEWMAEWLDGTAKPQVSRKTFERYGEIVRKHIVPALGAIRLHDLDATRIQRLYADALDHGHTVKGKPAAPLSPATVHYIHRVLFSALKSAVRLQKVGRNVAELVLPPKVQTAEASILTEAQATALLQRLRGSSMLVPVLLALTTGVRRGELLALRWTDLDLDRGVLQVAQAIEQTRAEGLRFKPPKTRRSRRSITLPATAVDQIRSHRARQAEQRLQAGPAWQDHGLVFCGPDGAPLNPRSFSKTINGHIRRVNPDATLHSLRHSHATQLLLAGVHPKVAQERLGHSSIAVTMDIYSHVLEGMQSEAARLVDEKARRMLSE